ncbi:unnamed protein product [marine sediment metagenome]|uniref:Uncharacterized protein n=1 Tax=marine sediment metagenome TaxID=412755 RepID=X1EBQ3_9ZZZZ
MNSCKYNRGYFYIGGVVSSNAQLFRICPNTNADLVYTIASTSGAGIKTFTEFHNWLWFGAADGKVYVRRPFQELQIEMHNTNATNPLA